MRFQSSSLIAMVACAMAVSALPSHPRRDIVSQVQVHQSDYASAAASNSLSAIQADATKTSQLVSQGAATAVAEHQKESSALYSSGGAGPTSTPTSDAADGDQIKPTPTSTPPASEDPTGKPTRTDGPPPPPDASGTTDPLAPTPSTTPPPGPDVPKNINMPIEAPKNLTDPSALSPGPKDLPPAPHQEHGQRPAMLTNTTCLNPDVFWSEIKKQMPELAAFEAKARDIIKTFREEGKSPVEIVKMHQEEEKKGKGKEGSKGEKKEGKDHKQSKGGKKDQSKPKTKEPLPASAPSTLAPTPPSDADPSLIPAKQTTPPKAQDKVPQAPPTPSRPQTQAPAPPANPEMPKPDSPNDGGVDASASDDGASASVSHRRRHSNDALTQAHRRFESYEKLSAHGKRAMGLEKAREALMVERGGPTSSVSRMGRRKVMSQPFAQA